MTATDRSLNKPPRYWLNAMKSFTRALIALFGAFFVSLYAQVSVCAHGNLGQPLNEWLCGHRLLPTWLLLIPVIFISLMFLLGKRCVAYRRTMSVLFLSTYGIYTAFESVKLHAWWQVPLSVAMLLAALSFVPGIAFGLLAGFCCYVAIRQRGSETGWV